MRMHIHTHTHARYSIGPVMVAWNVSRCIVTHRRMSWCCVVFVTSSRRVACVTCAACHCCVSLSRVMCRCHVPLSCVVCRHRHVPLASSASSQVFVTAAGVDFMPAQLYLFRNYELRQDAFSKVCTPPPPPRTHAHTYTHNPLLLQPVALETIENPRLWAYLPSAPAWARWQCVCLCGVPPVVWVVQFGLCSLGCALASL